ncbi:MAG: Hpt domain-containing protein, partial [Anaerolineae bacterium]|nr:Hpt domain-containing protein [Anaerolineae bacterium]
QNALKNEDLKTIKRSAHTLKSSGASLGAMHFSNLCLSLEKKLEKCEKQKITLNTIQDEVSTDLKIINEAFNLVRSHLLEYQLDLK